MFSVDNFKLYMNKQQAPKRVVSLCPSITETVCDLGLSKYLAGVTNYCIHPKSLTDKITKVGGPKDISVQAVKKIMPDIVLVSKEENKKSTVEQIAMEYPCVVFDVKEFNDALQMIQRLGEIFLVKDTAEMLVKKIKKAFNDISTIKDQISFLYLIWKNPYMAAGKDTFINSVLSQLSMHNCLTNFEKRYPNIGEQIQKLEFDILFLPSEPYKFELKDKEALQRQFPDKMIMLVDGEMFSWYGSHMLKAAEYFKEITSLISHELAGSNAGRVMKKKAHYK